MEQKTSCVIVHRLSTMQIAAKIIVIVNGTFVETGTHIEWLA